MDYLNGFIKNKKIQSGLKQATVLRKYRVPYRLDLTNPDRV